MMGAQTRHGTAEAAPCSSWRAAPAATSFPRLPWPRCCATAAIAVVWLGVPGSMESRLVPANGFPIEWVRVGGVRGKGWKTWLLAPVTRGLRGGRMRCGCCAAFDRSAVLGAGGYVSGPGGIAAWLLRIPLLIHEQNAVAGMTNRCSRALQPRCWRRFRAASRRRPGLAPAPSAIRCAPISRRCRLPMCASRIGAAARAPADIRRQPGRAASELRGAAGAGQLERARVARRSAIRPASAASRRRARPTGKRRWRPRCCPSSTTWPKPMHGPTSPCAAPAP